MSWLLLSLTVKNFLYKWNMYVFVYGLCLAAHVWVCAARSENTLGYCSSGTVLFVLFYLCILVYVHVCGGAHEGQRVLSDLLELKLEVFVSQPEWFLGSEFQSSDRAVLLTTEPSFQSPPCWFFRQSLSLSWPLSCRLGCLAKDLSVSAPQGWDYKHAPCLFFYFFLTWIWGSN